MISTFVLDLIMCMLMSAVISVLVYQREFFLAVICLLAFIIGRYGVGL